MLYININRIIRMFLNGNIRVGILPLALGMFCIGIAIIWLIIIIVKKNKKLHSHMLDISRLTKENHSLAKQNKELTKEEKSHLAQISKVTSDKDDINRKLKKSQNKVEQLEKDNLRLRTENKNANNVFIQTKQALDEKDSLSAHLSQQLESVNAEFHKLKSEYTALDKKQQEKEEIIQQQSNSLDTISAEKEQNEKQNKELVQEIESLKQRCSDLESKLKKFENQQNYLAAETENPFERLARW